MSAALIAQVPTRSASRYLQQLCKHWSHKFAVEHDTERGTIALPLGRAELIAHPETLEVQLEPAAPDQAERMKTVMQEHLDRFAFREAPLAFDWREG